MNAAAARTPGIGRRALAALVALVVVVALVATAAAADPVAEPGAGEAPEVVVEPTDGFEADAEGAPEVPVDETDPTDEPGTDRDGTGADADGTEAEADAEPPAGREPDVSTRIVGGIQAPPGAWPSQVALLQSGVTSNFNAQFCGGTVIDRWWVLTAAHCLIEERGRPRFTAPEVDVLVGTQSLMSGGQRIRAREIRIIDGFGPASFHRDVALVRLSRPSTEPVQELTAAGVAVPTGTDVVATGWGTTAYGRGDRQRELRQVGVHVLADTSCTQEGSYGRFFKSSSMMCAGVAGGGRDACQGDSGGPLVRNVSGRWVQVGITSWGEKCGLAAYPGIYTKLSAFRGWTDLQLRYGPHADPNALVERTHLDLFRRFPTANERWNGVVALNGGTTPQAYVGQLVQGDAYQRATGGVTRLYLAYFGRYPDQTGMTDWWQRINGGWSLARVSQAFAGSAEFRNRYGSLTNGQFVDLVYRNVLGRPGDASGRAYWLDHLNRGTRTRGEVMIGFSESLEFRRAKKAEVDVVITWFAMLRLRPIPDRVETWRSRTNDELIAHLFDSATYHGRF